jgi:pyruvate, water dikinase
MNMNKKEKSLGDLLYALGERAKELNCLYHVEEVLSRRDAAAEDVFAGIIAAIPPGWQFPDICRVRIRYGKRSFTSPDFEETKWRLVSKIVVQDKVEGSIEVYYTRSVGTTDEDAFLEEERKLINTIAERVGHFLLHQRLKNVFQEWQSLKEQLAENTRAEWKVILGMLQRTDQSLYTRISRKMLNRLCWSGITSACELMQRFGARGSDAQDVFVESNRPRQREELISFLTSSDEIFQIAAEHLSEEEILNLIQKWIKDDKASFLVNSGGEPRHVARRNRRRHRPVLSYFSRKASISLRRRKKDSASPSSDASSPSSFRTSTSPNTTSTCAILQTSYGISSIIRKATASWGVRARALPRQSYSS